MGLWNFVCAFNEIIAESTINNYERLERKSRFGHLTEEEADKLQQYQDNDSYNKSQQMLDYINSRKNRDK